jgi:hypothetical protein
MARFYSDAAGESATSRSIDKVQEAVALHALTALPSATAAAVVQRDSDNAPVALVVASGEVYALECAPPEDEMSHATTRCRLVTLDPRRDSVEMGAEFRPRTAGPILVGRARHATWRFELRGEVYTVKTVTDEDGESDDRELVARQLAAALGWDLPTPEEMRAAA